MRDAVLDEVLALQKFSPLKLLTKLTKLGIILCAK